MSDPDNESSGKKWVDVVTHPLGLVGYALFLVFGLLSLSDFAAQHPWLPYAAVTLEGVAVLGGIALAFKDRKHPPPPPPVRNATTTPTTAVTQRTQGGGPTIGAGAGPAHIGDVHHHASPVDQKTLARINELLDKKDLELAEREREKEEWVKKYQDLAARLKAE